MLEAGQNLSRYKVISLLGTGGMGEVYLAEDISLGRKVALKVLPKDVASNSDRIRRFEQEARAASALNHPNILTIFEVSEAEGINYISTEYIDGMSLRELVRSDPPEIDQLLDIAIQAASALAAAHDAGITHRDIKPENIIVRRDGLVKVLDFGLAKLSAAEDAGVDSEGETRAQVNTAPGVIMGTVQYMSPEQTRGKAVDARSDIWSLGCVIYEMAAGQPPFSGETTADLIAEIVKMNPVPLGQAAPDAPERLDEIVSKALEKIPDERYQTSRDLLNDLRRLKKKKDLELESERSHSPDTVAIRSKSPSERETAAFAASTLMTDAERHSTVSGAEFLTSGIKRHKMGSAAAAVIVLLVLAGFGYGIYQFLQGSRAVETPRTSVNLTTQRLTGDGRTREPTISPDGKFLVYVKLEEGKQSLWIKQIMTGSNVNVVKPGEGTAFNGITFSPDGNFVYFNANMGRAEKPTVYRVPTLGGTPVKFLTDALFLRFSSDGKFISFRRPIAAEVKDTVFVANADGSNEREMVTRRGKQFFASEAAWSPDGARLAISIGDDDLGATNAMSLAMISVADGSMHEFGSRRWDVLDDVVWHPSGDSLIITATEKTLPQAQLWEITYPSGEPRKLTNSLNGSYGVSITADGRSIVTGERYAQSAVWVSPDLKPENAKQVMPSTGDTWGLSWTPDGRIVYVSDQTGDAEVWIMNADGTEARPLTNDRIVKAVPTVSPDGRYVVYTSWENGGQLVRIDISGGNPVVLTKSVGADNGHISPDGRWVIYSAFLEGLPKVLRVSINGGEEKVLTDYHATEPRYSYDGTRFACFMLDEKTLDWTRLAIVPAEGGAPVKVFEAPSETNSARGPVWTPDDKAITMVVAPGEKQNLWVQPIDGGPARAMTDFNNPGIARREYSRDGKRIAIVRAEGIGNAVMITNYR